MRGWVKFFLAIIFLFLLGVTGSLIYGLFWIERHLYLDEQIPIELVELDIAEQTRLLRLVPLKQILSKEAGKDSLRAKLNEKEANWLLNRALAEQFPDAKAQIKFMDGVLGIKFSQRVNPEKFLNIMLDAEINAEKGDFQVKTQRLQLGDYVLPNSVLGQLNYLLELYLERGIKLKEGQVIKILDFKLDRKNLYFSLLRTD